MYCGLLEVDDLSLLGSFMNDAVYIINFTLSVKWITTFQFSSFLFFRTFFPTLLMRIQNCIKTISCFLVPKSLSRRGEKTQGSRQNFSRQLYFVLFSSRHYFSQSLIRIDNFKVTSLTSATSTLQKELRDNSRHFCRVLPSGPW